MSLVFVESSPPFLDEAVLAEALAAMGSPFEVTPEGFRVRVNGAHVELRKRFDAWLLRRRNDAAHADWERRLVAEYETVRARRLQMQDDVARGQQLLREEAQRRRVVSARRDAIVERARALGYSIQEERIGEEVRLVLVRRS